MATNLVYRNTDSQNRVETLADTYGPGEACLTLDGRPAVTVTGSGDYTITDAVTFAPITLTAIPAGGIGLVGKEVTLACDGTWEFLASAFSDTDPVPGSITQGTLINFATSGKTLTTTAVTSGIVAWGVIDFPKDYDKTRGYVPVRIGVR